MRVVIRWAMCLTALLLLGMAPLGATAIGNNQWYEFLFGGVGSFGGACGSSCVPGVGSVDAGDAPWTITIDPGGAVFELTDGFSSGDSFTLLDFGVPVGSTPVVATGGDLLHFFGGAHHRVPAGSTPVVPTGSSCGNDPVACLANPGMSSALFFIAGGDHSFTIQTDVSPFGGGAAFFQVVVPEPGTAALVGSGLLAVALLLRRRTKR